MVHHKKYAGRFMRTVGVITALLFLLIVAGCGSSSTGTGGETGSSGEKSAKLNVAATIYPVYDVAKQVGGDKVDLTLLVPPGSEPHDWDPTVNDLRRIGEAKLFLYNGAGLEPTAKLLTPDVLRQAKPLEMASFVALLPGDPHIWLDPTNVMKEADTIAKAFGEADPANQAYYEANAKAYKAKLSKLNDEYEAFTKGLKDRNLVVSHEAFGYLANRYNLVQLGIMGINPDTEPTPDKMASIVSFIRAHQVKAIFSEELVSPKLTEAIAGETGAKVYLLNPVEGLTEEQTKAGDNYLTLMEKNLATLKQALQ